MRTLEDFQSRHTDLQESIRDLRALLQPTTLSVKPAAMTAHQELCQLVEKANKHFIIVLRGVYPPLLIHEDVQLKKLAWDFIRGEKPLRERLDSFQKLRLKDFDLNFTPEFIDDILDLLNALEARIEQEQTIFLPRLQEKGAFAQAV
ncbi:MAG: hemerythrin domain-containing protein [Chromatiales bacterium]|jgi:hypothetical protein